MHNKSSWVVAAVLGVILLLVLAILFGMNRNPNETSSQTEQQKQPAESLVKSEESPSSVPEKSPLFFRDLCLGSQGEDVKQLQTFLNNAGYSVSDTGHGSPGQESSCFGRKTQRALIRYQAANDISPAKGYFGKITRAQVNAVLTKKD